MCRWLEVGRLTLAKRKRWSWDLGRKEFLSYRGKCRRSCGSPIKRLRWRDVFDCRSWSIAGGCCSDLSLVASDSWRGNAGRGWRQDWGSWSVVGRVSLWTADMEKTHSWSSSCLFLLLYNQFRWGLSERCSVAANMHRITWENEVELWDRSWRFWYSHPGPWWPHELTLASSSSIWLTNARCRLSKSPTWRDFAIAWKGCSDGNRRVRLLLPARIRKLQLILVI